MRLLLYYHNKMITIMIIIVAHKTHYYLLFAFFSVASSFSPYCSILCTADWIWRYTIENNKHFWVAICIAALEWISHAIDAKCPSVAGPMMNHVNFNRIHQWTCPLNFCLMHLHVANFMAMRPSHTPLTSKHTLDLWNELINVCACICVCVCVLRTTDAAHCCGLLLLFGAMSIANSWITTICHISPCVRVFCSAAQSERVTINSKQIILMICRTLRHSSE